MPLARLKLAFALVVGVLALGWLLSVDVARLAGGFWAARGLLIPFTGVLAVGFMAVAVLLAARPVQIEPALGGLDKFYRLHKWLGIAGLVAAIAHWLLEILPRQVVRLGWLERPARPTRPPGAAEPPLQALRDPAAEIGEWGLYLLIALVVLALWRRFPYHLFFKTHRLMAPLFLAFVFHAVVLTPADYWTAPVGPVLALLLAAGSAAAGVSLFRRIGHSRKAVGAVKSFHLHSGAAVLDLTVELETAWRGHAAGQFAFLDFDDAEGAHPFSMASGWRGDGQIAFSIKGLGDYTRQLPEMVRVGQAVTVEGPYGRFDFEGAAQRQLWIAGGVGITPFVARLEATPEAPLNGPVDLVYSTAGIDEAFVGEVRSLAGRAGARLHLVDSQTQGLVTLERIETWVPQWREADVWFCGPAAFGETLQAAMVRQGLPRGRFHQELFEMR